MERKVLVYSCPYGKVNDPFPGYCVLYSDANQNTICDRGEVLAIKESGGGVADYERINIDMINQSAVILAIATFSFYIFYWYLVNKTNLGRKIKLFSQFYFRLFWNMVLLFTSIPTILSGFLFILDIKSPELLVWHIRLGVIFAVASLPHIFVHLRYLKTGLEKLAKP